MLFNTRSRMPGRSQSDRPGRLHWLHWLAVAGSLVLTLIAWQMAKHKVHDRVSRQFDRESTQVIELVRERMQKYEDALWAGVALHDTLGSKVNHEQWRRYAESLRIDEKYPGINGVGVIYAIDPAKLPEFVAEQQKLRPSFKVFPPHDRPVAYPITFIEPQSENIAAMGLDVAHEQNRFTAAQQALKTGTSQITAPIVLVQDSAQTPGFLFLAPIYSHGACETADDHYPCFKGMIYAPFVAKRLMEGVLSKDNRHVGIRLSDNNETLYDEFTESNADFDPTPLFNTLVEIPMHGRLWSFDIRSGRSFRDAQKSSQPLMILIGGVVIDALLVMLFVTLSNSNRKAISYADRVTEELQQKNGELEQYVYTASHDLKSPLFTIQGFAGLLMQDLEEENYTETIDHTRRIISGVNRMRANIDDLLELSKVGRVTNEMRPVRPDEIINGIVNRLGSQLEDAGASVSCETGMPLVHGDPDRLTQAFENLIVNALAHARNGQALRVEITAKREHEMVVISFADNGPGIPEPYRKQVFELFHRLDTNSEGTGVGLSIVRRVSEVHLGRVWIEDSQLGGAIFCMALPEARVGSLHAA